MAITDKIYLKNHRQIASQLEVNIPKGAFSGATMDVLYSGEGLESLNSATRDRVLAFAEDFMDCGCDTAPYCGHPEEKFAHYLLELREQGLDPDTMVDVMTDDYMVYAYSGDLLSFLDDSVRTLEAIQDLAAVEGNEEAERRAREAKRGLVR